MGMGGKREVGALLSSGGMCLTTNAAKFADRTSPFDGGKG